ncbi:MAG: S1 RNA-binding domain-containing protein [Nitrospiraceae bacterium]|nr:S1 RNA-binding domain-containing protein [Nitrospiraceae bacterium]
MSEIYVKNKDVVIPGELLGKGMDLLPSGSTYREGENIYSSKVGLINLEGRLIKVIPLVGPYLPQKGDVVIGIVSDVLLSGWRVDIGAPSEAMLSVRDAVNEYVQKGDDLRRILDIDDVVLVKVTNVTTQMLIDLTMKGPGLKKIYGGRLIKVTPTKVPRIIGKKGSMINTIKDMTKCKIVVGQNGKVWINGDPEMEIIATKAIRKIEAEAHTSGLTDRIHEFLKENIGEDSNKPNNDKEENNGKDSKD